MTLKHHAHRHCDATCRHVFPLKVHFNLFGGTVLKLGTKTHHDAMLAGIDRLDPTGCFALTELGFGERAGSPGFMRLCSHPPVLVSSRVLMNMRPSYFGRQQRSGDADDSNTGPGA
jgi:hypothetical protein